MLDLEGTIYWPFFYRLTSSYYVGGAIGERLLH